MSAAVALLPVAHLGHWWTYVLYGIPVVIVLVSVVMTLVRQHRDGRPHDGSSE